VVNSTERCQAAARVRKVAAKFQALAVIPQLQALFLIRLVSNQGQIWMEADSGQNDQWRRFQDYDHDGMPSMNLRSCWRLASV
jgi:hypothetical protein